MPCVPVSSDAGDAEVTVSERVVQESLKPRSLVCCEQYAPSMSESSRESDRDRMWRYQEERDKECAEVRRLREEV